MLNGMLHLSSSRVARAFLLGALALALIGAAATTPPPPGQSFSQDELMPCSRP